MNDFVAYWRDRFGSRYATIIPYEAQASVAHTLHRAVERAFETTTADQSDKALLLILCARFVKGNVLYRAKSIAALDEQLENMDIGAQSIAVVLSLVRPHVYRR
jgi:hypothetical protein